MERLNTRGTAQEQKRAESRCGWLLVEDQVEGAE
jgi:hypothetical protein